MAGPLRGRSRVSLPARALAGAPAYIFPDAEIVANIALSRRDRERERGRETEYYPVEMLTSSETRPALVPGLPPCGGKFRKVHAGGKLYAIHCAPWTRYRLELAENFRATDFFGAPCARQNGAHPVAFERDQRRSVFRVRVPLSRGTFRCISAIFTPRRGYQVLAFARISRDTSKHDVYKGMKLKRVYLCIIRLLSRNHAASRSNRSCWDEKLGKVCATETHNRRTVRGIFPPCRMD